MPAVCGTSISSSSVSNWLKTSGVAASFISGFTAGFIIGFIVILSDYACEFFTGAVCTEGASNGAVNEAVDELAFANRVSVWTTSGVV